MSMRTIGALVASGLVVVLSACAGTKEAQKDVEGMIAGAEQTSTGVVVQTDEQQIAVKDVKNPEGEAVWFARQTDTELEKDGQPVDWSELTEGTPVRVHFEESTGAEKAFKVEVLTGSEGEKVKSQVPVEAPAWRKPTGLRSKPAPTTEPMDD